MKKILLLFLLLIGISILGKSFLSALNPISGAPPYYVEGDTAPNVSDLRDEYAYLKDWKRPDGPPRIGLQVGHYQNEALPDELERLRGNTGATGDGYAEWEVNLQIANLTKEILEKKGVAVDIIPATVPPDYIADAFIAIHADGNLDPAMSGYKAAAPRRDLTGKARELVALIESSYATATGLVYDPNVTRNMRGYYAFSYWRFDHAVHPMTPSIILETGFLTSPNDREIIVYQPEIASEGIATGIINFLKQQGLLS